MSATGTPHTNANANATDSAPLLHMLPRAAAQEGTEGGEGTGQDTHRADVAAKKKKLAAAAMRKAKEQSKVPG